MASEIDIFVGLKVSDNVEPIPGSLKIKCEECSAEMWMAPSSQQLEKQGVFDGVRKICTDCAVKEVEE